MRDRDRDRRCRFVVGAARRVQTYGVGRALAVPMGGLSIDNVVRVHRVAPADWYLLQVTPEAIEGGLGFGSARVYADGSLIATGTQSIVVNGWDWRLPDERGGSDPDAGE